MTGKSGRTAMGIFAAQDEITNLIFPSNQGSSRASLDQDAFGGVFDSWFGPDRVGMTRTDRTFFLKIGYAWQI